MQENILSGVLSFLKIHNYDLIEHQGDARQDDCEWIIAFVEQDNCLVFVKARFSEQKFPPVQKLSGNERRVFEGKVRRFLENNPGKYNDNYVRMDTLNCYLIPGPALNIRIEQNSSF